MADVIITIKGKDDASDEIKSVITSLNKLDSATKEPALLPASLT